MRVDARTLDQGDHFHAMHHRLDQALVTWWPTWAPLVRLCPLATAADWGHVPRLCPDVTPSRQMTEMLLSRWLR